MFKMNKKVLNPMVRVESYVKRFVSVVIIIVLGFYAAGCGRLAVKNVDEGADKGSSPHLISSDPKEEPQASDTPKPQDEPAPKAAYANIDELQGALNDNGATSFGWQSSGMIKSEGDVSMFHVCWATDYDTRLTSTKVDLDGDGKDDRLSIENDPETNSLVIIAEINGKRADLLSRVSEEYLIGLSNLVSNNYFIPGTQIDASAVDLDGNGKKEIVIAAGNDNGILAVSVLRYTGGDNLYSDAGGFTGTKWLRFVIIRDSCSLYAQLYFTNSYGSNTNYVEFEYAKNALTLARYRNQ